MTEFLKTASRRTFLAGAAGLGLAAPLGFLGGSSAFAAIERTKKAKDLPPSRIRIAIMGSPCMAPVHVAKGKGLDKKYNLDMQLVPVDIGFASPNNRMITGPERNESDAIAAMVYNFMRPIAEDGVKLKFVTGIHGGCVRVIGSKKAGVTTLESLKGKKIALPGELRGEDAVQYFPAMLKTFGLRPEKDVLLVWGPDGKNPEALASGAVDAYMQVDPIIHKAQRENPDFVEIINNQTGPWSSRTCCVIAASDDYVEKNPLALTALTFALEDATAHMMAHPEEAAAHFPPRPYFTKEDVVASLVRMDNHAHRVNHDFRGDIAFYAASLKAIGGFNDPNLDPEAFADKYTVKVVC